MTLAIVQLTDEVASYMTRRLLQLTEPDELVAIPDTWTHEMAEDCDRAVRIVAQARENRCKWRLVTMAGVLTICSADNLGRATLLR